MIGEIIKKKKNKFKDLPLNCSTGLIKSRAIL